MEKYKKLVEFIRVEKSKQSKYETMYECEPQRLLGRLDVLDYLLEIIDALDEEYDQNATCENE